MNVTSSHKRPDISEFNLTAAEIMQQYIFERSRGSLHCFQCAEIRVSDSKAVEVYVVRKGPLVLFFAIAAKENTLTARNGL